MSTNGSAGGIANSSGGGGGGGGGGIFSTVASWVSHLLQSLGWWQYFFRDKSGHLVVLGLDNAGKTTLLHRLQHGMDSSHNNNNASNNNNSNANGTSTNGLPSFPPTDRPVVVQECVIPTSSSSGARGGGGSFGPMLRVQCTDLGGHEAVRHLWRDYYVYDPDEDDDDDDDDDERLEMENGSSPQLRRGRKQRKGQPHVAILFLVDAADAERLEEAAYELDAVIHDNVVTTNADATSTTAVQRSTLPPLALLLNKCDLPNALSTAEICERLEWPRLLQTHPHMAVFRISVLKGEGYADALSWIAEGW